MREEAQNPPFAGGCQNPCASRRQATHTPSPAPAPMCRPEIVRSSRGEGCDVTAFGVRRQLKAASPRFFQSIKARRGFLSGGVLASEGLELLMNYVGIRIRGLWKHIGPERGWLHVQGNPSYHLEPNSSPRSCFPKGGPNERGPANGLFT